MPLLLFFVLVSCLRRRLCGAVLGEPGKVEQEPGAQGTVAIFGYWMSPNSTECRGRVIVVGDVVWRPSVISE